MAKFNRDEVKETLSKILECIEFILDEIEESGKAEKLVLDFMAMRIKEGGAKRLMASEWFDRVVMDGSLEFKMEKENDE